MPGFATYRFLSAGIEAPPELFIPDAESVRAQAPDPSLEVKRPSAPGANLPDACIAVVGEILIQTAVKPQTHWVCSGRSGVLPVVDRAKLLVVPGDRAFFQRLD